jgi:hypothetical protein
MSPRQPSSLDGTPELVAARRLVHEFGLTLVCRHFTYRPLGLKGL